MSDIVERLQRGVDTNEPPDKTDRVMYDAANEIERLRGELHSVHAHLRHYRDLVDQLRAEIGQQRAFVGWVDSWVSNPVGAYSVSALDGLFGMTRDKIRALEPPTMSSTQEREP